MKIKYILGVLSLFLLAIGVAHAATSQLSVKVGDAAYVCPCGSKCECDTIALKPGKCGCGHELVKVTVTKVKGKKAYYALEGKETSHKLTAKYACSCEGDCCEMISNKPGKCGCGKELAKVGKAK